MTQRKPNVKGAQQHAEGQHGEKAHARFQEQLKESPLDRDEPGSEVTQADSGQTGTRRESSDNR
jgi:hypothetical protein